LKLKESLDVGGFPRRLKKKGDSSFEILNGVRLDRENRNTLTKKVYKY